jgi:hypothetical protein
MIAPKAPKRFNDVNQIYVLLFCLCVVAVIFAGSIMISVFYVQQNRIAPAQSQGSE